MSSIFNALLEERWVDLSRKLPDTFTTQTFLRTVQSTAPTVWDAIFERYGNGGKGSGKFYSPANTMFFFLKLKAREGEIVEKGFVRPEKGWGTNRVIEWQKRDTIPLP